MRSPKACSLYGAAILSFVLTACGAAGSGVQTGSATLSHATNVLPQLVSISPTEKMLFIPASDRTQPPAGVPAIINAWVSLSAAVSGTPCDNCVGNPPIGDALGVAFPQPYLSHTAEYEITYMFDNVSEGTSSCKLTFHFKQGTTSLLSNTSTIKLNGDGQYVYFVAGPASSKAKAGAATVTANVTCNGFTPKIATQADHLF